MKIWIEAESGEMPDLKGYFWGGDVIGFDSTEHCQKCLKFGKGGLYTDLHKNQLATVNTVFEPAPTPEGYFYLCASKNKDKTWMDSFYPKRKSKSYRYGKV